MMRFMAMGSLVQMPVVHGTQSAKNVIVATDIHGMRGRKHVMRLSQTKMLAEQPMRRNGVVPRPAGSGKMACAKGRYVKRIRNGTMPSTSV